MPEPKHEYTQGNHYRWGWDGSWFNTPDPLNPETRFQVTLSGCTRPPKSFREEVVQTCRDIAANAKKPIIVGLSGGSDSQMACLGFLEAGIPFKVVVVTMTDDRGDSLNDHDTQYADMFIERHGLEKVSFTMDLEHFYRTTGMSYAMKYGIANPETIVQTATMDFVANDYCYIMAGGDIMMAPRRMQYFPKMRSIPRLENGLSVPSWLSGAGPQVMQHMIEREYEGSSKFFLYSPELIMAYLTHPVCQRFYDAQESVLGAFVHMQKPVNWWKCFHYLIKPMMTKAEFPELIHTRKYTGFEKTYAKGSNRMSYYRAMLAEAAGPLKRPQAVLVPISEMIQTLQMPGEHVWRSTDLEKAQVDTSAEDVEETEALV